MKCGLHISLTPRFSEVCATATIPNRFSGFPRTFCLRPASSLETLFIEGPIIRQKLNEIDSRTMIGEGRVYGGGLHKLEPSELANVPDDGIPV